MSYLGQFGGEVLQTNILTIGGGLAGATAAIKTKEAGVKSVTPVSEGKLGKDSISSFAAGVWRSFMPEDDKDALRKAFALNDGHGGGLYDEDWLEVYLDENYDRLLELERWGVEWEKTPDGKFERSRLASVFEAKDFRKGGRKLSLLF